MVTDVDWLEKSPSPSVARCMYKVPFFSQSTCNLRMIHDLEGAYFAFVDKYSVVGFFDPSKSF